jgi:transketolase
MRDAFINTLERIAEIEKNIFLLTGDLGFSIFERYIKKFPDRFINAGVAEQNMLGIAAGMALEGKTVFVYSIIPFATMRCFEQIRNDVCMQKLNVKIVGVGAGLNYGPAGPTHHAIEDLALMRALPNMTIFSPSTGQEVESSIESAIKINGPVYVRLGKRHDSAYEYNRKQFKVGKGVLLADGKDIAIIVTGAILSMAEEIVALFKNKGIKARLISLHTIKPIDKGIIIKAAKETKMLCSIEEHSEIGGLGSAVAEVLAESNVKVEFKKFALPDSFIKYVGKREYLLEKSGLSAARIYAEISRILGAA